MWQRTKVAEPQACIIEPCAWRALDLFAQRDDHTWGGGSHYAVGSVSVAKQRSAVNCSFIGMEHPPRKTMFAALRTQGADLKCLLASSKAYGGGKSSWDYVTKTLEISKIGLCPSGNNPETHRMAELLATGTVPAMLDYPFLHATFTAPPVIVGGNWTEVISRMRGLLVDRPGLERLQMEGAEWYGQLHRCITCDLDAILFTAMRLHKLENASLTRPECERLGGHAHWQTGTA
eukprot:CAMPEP_0196752532 /NCGR_PEP_ID=MMETSP1091-20130531/87438_1 /TAXON_ID=302021 /ORGANISM="Rhodomonas sp., Strain CCMP768" /LENGTH=232 /DNA_ID=CAMNT_0042100491 /DNA_START=257 /DNA_END=956 /DNA_ORIENTATION=+